MMRMSRFSDPRFSVERRIQDLQSSLRAAEAVTPSEDFLVATKAIDALVSVCMGADRLSEPIASVAQCAGSLELLLSRFDQEIGFKIDGAKGVKCLPVLEKLREFLGATSPYVNFVSPTGTGKSMALPVLYLARDVATLAEDNASTLLVMCQPKPVPIRQTQENISKVLSRVTEATRRRIRAHRNVHIAHSAFSKDACSYGQVSGAGPPTAHFVACLPSAALDLFFRLYHSGLLGRTRWIIDEVHERSADVDLLLTYLAVVRVAGQEGDYLPLRKAATPQLPRPPPITEAVVTLMTATPDAAVGALLVKYPPPHHAQYIRNSPPLVTNITIENKNLFPVTRCVSMLQPKGLHKVLEGHCANIAATLVCRMVMGAGDHPPPPYSALRKWFDEKDKAAWATLSGQSPRLGHVLAFMAGYKECVGQCKGVAEQFPADPSALFPPHNNAVLPPIIAIRSPSTPDLDLEGFRAALVAEIEKTVNTAAEELANDRSPSAPTAASRAFPVGGIVVLMPLVIAGRANECEKDFALSHDALPCEGAGVLLRPDVANDLERVCGSTVRCPIPITIIRVIAATNAVESSVTIPNLSVVVDSGFHKESRYDPVKDLSSLELKPIAQTSVTQRAGRCGRTQEGWVWRVAASGAASDGASAAATTTPELTVCDMGRLIVRLLCNDVDLASIIPKLPTPIEQSRVDSTYSRLVTAGIVSSSGSRNIITTLGRRVNIYSAAIPTSHAVQLLRSLDRITSDNTLSTLGMKRTAFVESVVLLAAMAHGGQSTFREDMLLEAFAPIADYFCGESDVVTIGGALLRAIPSASSKGFRPSMPAPRGFQKNEFIKIRGYIADAISALVYSSDNKFDTALMPPGVANWYFTNHCAPDADASEAFPPFFEEDGGEARNSSLWEQVAKSFPSKPEAANTMKKRLLRVADGFVTAMFASDNTNIVAFKEALNLSERACLVFSAHASHGFADSKFKGDPEVKCFGRPLADFPVSFNAMYAMRINRNETATINVVSLLHRVDRPNNASVILSMPAVSPSLAVDVAASAISAISGTAKGGLYPERFRGSNSSQNTVLRVDPSISQMQANNVPPRLLFLQAAVNGNARAQCEAVGVGLSQALVRHGCSQILHLVSSDIAVLYTGDVEGSCLVPKCAAVLEANDGIPDGLYTLPMLRGALGGGEFATEMMHQALDWIDKAIADGQASIVLATPYQIGDKVRVEAQPSDKLTCFGTNGELPVITTANSVRCAPFIALYCPALRIPSLFSMCNTIEPIRAVCVAADQSPVTFGKLYTALADTSRVAGASSLVQILPVVYVVFDTSECEEKKFFPPKIDSSLFSFGSHRMHVHFSYPISRTRLSGFANRFVVAFNVVDQLGNIPDDAFCLLRSDVSASVSKYLATLPKGVKLADDSPIRLGVTIKACLAASPAVHTLMRSATAASGRADNDYFANFYHIVSGAVAQADPHASSVALDRKTLVGIAEFNKKVREVKDTKFRSALPSFTTHTLDIPVLDLATGLRLAADLQAAMATDLHDGLAPIPLRGTDITWRDLTLHRNAMRVATDRIAAGLAEGTVPKAPPITYHVPSSDRVGIEAITKTCVRCFLIPSYISRGARFSARLKPGVTPPSRGVLQQTFGQPEQLQISQRGEQKHLTVDVDVRSLDSMLRLYDALRALLVSIGSSTSFIELQPIDYNGDVPSMLHGRRNMSKDDLLAMPGVQEAAASVEMLSSRPGGVIVSLSSTDTNGREECSDLLEMVADVLRRYDFGGAVLTMHFEVSEQVAYSLPNCPLRELRRILPSAKLSLKGDGIVVSFPDVTRKLSAVETAAILSLLNEDSNRPPGFAYVLTVPPPTLVTVTPPALALTAHGFLGLPKLATECEAFLRDHVAKHMHFTRIDCPWMTIESFHRMMGRWRLQTKGSSARARLQIGVTVTFVPSVGGSGGNVASPYLIIDSDLLAIDADRAAFEGALKMVKDSAETQQGTADGQSAIGCATYSCECNSAHTLSSYNNTGDEVSSALCMECVRGNLGSVVDTIVDPAAFASGTLRLFGRFSSARPAAIPVPKFEFPTSTFPNSISKMLGALWWVIFVEGQPSLFNGGDATVAKETLQAFTVWLTHTSLHAIAYSNRYMLCSTHCAPVNKNLLAPNPSDPENKARRAQCGCLYVWCAHENPARSHYRSSNEACAGEMSLCDDCPRCPKCKTPTLRTDGCSHMTCPCGHHWCYQCPPLSCFGAERGGLIYSHLSEAHGGGSGEDPPHVVRYKRKLGMT